jgi:glycerophosphoryl diester phosphodiesterase
VSVWSSREKKLLYAHRGAAIEQPENTLPSFRRGLELGADVLETDAHMTADGHVVLSHDPRGARMANADAEIRRTALADVQRWDAGWGFRAPDGARPFAGRGYRIPTLEEALVEFPGTPFNVDLKQREPDMVPAVLALLRRLRAEERVLLASASARTLRRARALGWEGAISLGKAQVAALYFLPKFALRLHGAAQVPVRAGRLHLGARAFIDKCHALGLRVDYWTVNDPAEARALLESGADGIMTDDPGAMREVFPS